MKLFLKLFLVSFLLFSAQQLLAQLSAWKTKDGWVLRKAAGKKKYEKFFAVGFWAVPGYKMSLTDEKDAAEYKKSEDVFKRKTEDFNVGIIQTGYDKPYMNDFVKAVGTAEFPKALFTYDEKSINDKRPDSAYYRMQQLRKDVANKRIQPVLDSTISRIVNRIKGDYIWAPIDEVANGRGWNFPTEAVDEIYKRIKIRQPQTLVYTDIAGTGKGSIYLFERKYLKTHGALPANPPYELLSKEAREIKNYPLLGFNQGYDGQPLYDFKNGKYQYKQYAEDELLKLWHENMKQMGEGYKNGGDVFGLNAFIDFNAYPVLAGVTVDGIKAGVGKKTPVWLYFDGNAYARGNQDISSYVQKVRCQMYTSIIHGATGIMLWNDVTKDEKFYDPMLVLINEIKKNEEVFKARTVAVKTDGHLHYIVKKLGKKKYIIATNTNTSKDITLQCGKLTTTLKPLQVYFEAL